MRTLLDVKEGERVKVVEIKGSPCFCNRMASVGLFPGTEVKVIKTAPGPVIVEVSGSRFALGKGMAKRVIVR